MAKNVSFRHKKHVVRPKKLHFVTFYRRLSHFFGIYNKMPQLCSVSFEQHFRTTKEIN